MKYAASRLSELILVTSDRTHSWVEHKLSRSEAKRERPSYRRIETDAAANAECRASTASFMLFGTAADCRGRQLLDFETRNSPAPSRTAVPVNLTFDLRCNVPVVKPVARRVAPVPSSFIEWNPRGRLRAVRQPTIVSRSAGQKPVPTTLELALVS
jgi:hypothetical protein